MNEPIPVQSSWVKDIWWLDGLLRVTTKKGATMTRVGVPESLWRQFQASTSKGEFFNKHIKNAFKEA